MKFKVITASLSLLITLIICEELLDSIEYYKKLIASTNQTFYTYNLPEDASEYKPVDDNDPAEGNISTTSLLPSRCTAIY